MSHRHQPRRHFGWESVQPTVQPEDYFWQCPLPKQASRRSMRIVGVHRAKPPIDDRATAFVLPYSGKDSAIFYSQRHRWFLWNGSVPEIVTLERQLPRTQAVGRIASGIEIVELPLRHCLLSLLSMMSCATFPGDIADQLAQAKWRRMKWRSQDDGCLIEYGGYSGFRGTCASCQFQFHFSRMISTADRWNRLLVPSPDCFHDRDNLKRDIPDPIWLSDVPFGLLYRRPGWQINLIESTGLSYRYYKNINSQ